MSVVRTIALTLALAVGAASVAAAQAPAVSTPDTTAQSGQHHRARRGARAMSQRLFEGITLTSAERTTVDSINHAYAAKMKPLMDSLRPAMKQARSDRQRGDTTAAAAAWKQTQGTRDQLMSLRKQQLADIRAVLTPQQQQQLDANVKTMKERGGKRGKKSGS